MDDETAVMSVLEIAHVLRVSKGTAYVYVQRGLIPHIRLSGRIIIPRARFEAWLNAEDKESGTDTAAAR
jgi:excisionase family DNA binding protein